MVPSRDRRPYRRPAGGAASMSADACVKDRVCIVTGAGRRPRDASTRCRSPATAPRSWSTTSAATATAPGADTGPAAGGRRRDQGDGRRGRRQHRRHQLAGTVPRASSQQAIDTFGGLDVLVNNAGILRDRMLFSMTEEEWDAVIRVHLKGTFAPSHHAAAYWRDRSKAGETDRRAADQHHVGVGPVRQRRPDQLRRGQGRHRRRSRRSPRRSCRATASPSTRSRPGALTRLTDDLEMTDEIRRNFAPHVGRARDHVVGVAGLRRRHRSGDRGVRPRARHRRGLAPRPVAPSRSSRRRRSARSCASSLADARPRTLFHEVS